MESLWLWTFGEEETYVAADVAWRKDNRLAQNTGNEKDGKSDRLIVFLIFVEWNLAKKWISPKFQSRVWSSLTRGATKPGRRKRHPHGLISPLKEEPNQPPLPYPTLPSPTPVFPGPLLLLPMTKHCARPKQKAQSLPPCQTASRPHRLAASARK